MAVAREVTRHDRIGGRPHSISDLGLEGAVAVPHQYRHPVVSGVGDGEVERTVAREVTRHDRIGV